MSNTTVAYVAPFLESIKHTRSAYEQWREASHERLRQKIEGVLLDAGADGVEWGTELGNTAETLVDVVKEWLAEG
jgi:hypothetical protein